MSKKKKKEKDVDLKSLDFKIDEFGNIRSTVSLKDINRFLDENVEDKKLIEKKEKEEKKKKGDS